MSRTTRQTRKAMALVWAVGALMAPAIAHAYGRQQPAPTVPSPATPNLNGWLICLQSNVTLFAEWGSRYA